MTAAIVTPRVSPIAPVGTSISSSSAQCAFARRNESAMPRATKASPAAKGNSKPPTTPRRRPAKKQQTVLEAVTGESSTVTPPDSSGRRESARQVEHLALLTLALTFGVIGLAVHILWFAAIVVMSILLGLLAAELRGQNRGGGVISEVVSSVVDGAKSVVEDVTGSNTPKASRADASTPARAHLADETA
jgi:Flp pilus assembly protein TadB